MIKDPDDKYVCLYRGVNDWQLKSNNSKVRQYYHDKFLSIIAKNKDQHAFFKFPSAIWDAEEFSFNTRHKLVFPTNSAWSHIETREIKMTTNSITCNYVNMGGSVKLLSWCPNVSDNRQILCVLVSSNNDAPCLDLTPPENTDMIHFWDCGDKTQRNEVPKLLYSFEHRWGSILSMQWISPDQTNRASFNHMLNTDMQPLYGHMLFCCTDGFMRICPIPKMAPLTHNNGQTSILQLNPANVLKLGLGHDYLNDSRSMFGYPTCAHWISQFPGTIIAGYSSGHIGVFDLTCVDLFHYDFVHHYMISIHKRRMSYYPISSVSLSPLDWQTFNYTVASNDPDQCNFVHNFTERTQPIVLINSTKVVKTCIWPSRADLLVSVPITNDRVDITSIISRKTLSLSVNGIRNIVSFDSDNSILITTEEGNLATVSLNEREIIRYLMTTEKSSDDIEEPQRIHHYRFLDKSNSMGGTEHDLIDFSSQESHSKLYNNDLSLVHPLINAIAINPNIGATGLTAIGFSYGVVHFLRIVEEDINDYKIFSQKLSVENNHTNTLEIKNESKVRKSSKNNIKIISKTPTPKKNADKSIKVAKSKHLKSEIDPLDSNLYPQRQLPKLKKKEKSIIKTNDKPKSQSKSKRRRSGSYDDKRSIQASDNTSEATEPAICTGDDWTILDCATTTEENDNNSEEIRDVAGGEHTKENIDVEAQYTARNEVETALEFSNQQKETDDERMEIVDDLRSKVSTENDRILLEINVITSPQDGVTKSKCDGEIKEIDNNLHSEVQLDEERILHKKYEVVMEEFLAPLKANLDEVSDGNVEPNEEGEDLREKNMIGSLDSIADETTNVIKENLLTKKLIEDEQFVRETESNIEEKTRTEDDSLQVEKLKVDTEVELERNEVVFEDIKDYEDYFEGKDDDQTFENGIDTGIRNNNDCAVKLDIDCKDFTILQENYSDELEDNVVDDRYNFEVSYNGIEDEMKQSEEETIDSTDSNVTVKATENEDFIEETDNTTEECTDDNDLHDFIINITKDADTDSHDKSTLSEEKSIETEENDSDMDQRSEEKCQDIDTNCEDTVSVTMKEDTSKLNIDVETMEPTDLMVANNEEIICEESEIRESDETIEEIKEEPNILLNDGEETIENENASIATEIFGADLTDEIVESALIKSIHEENIGFLSEEMETKELEIMDQSDENCIVSNENENILSNVIVEESIVIEKSVHEMENINDEAELSKEYPNEMLSDIYNVYDENLNKEEVIHTNSIEDITEVGAQVSEVEEERVEQVGNFVDVIDNGEVERICEAYLEEDETMKEHSIELTRDCETSSLNVDVNVTEESETTHNETESIGSVVNVGMLNIVKEELTLIGQNANSESTEYAIDEDKVIEKINLMVIETKDINKIHEELKQSNKGRLFTKSGSEKVPNAENVNVKIEDTISQHAIKTKDTSAESKKTSEGEQPKVLKRGVGRPHKALSSKRGRPEGIISTRKLSTIGNQVIVEENNPLKRTRRPSKLLTDKQFSLSGIKRPRIDDNKQPKVSITTTKFNSYRKVVQQSKHRKILPSNGRETIKEGSDENISQDYRKSLRQSLIDKTELYSSSKRSKAVKIKTDLGDGELENTVVVENGINFRRSPSQLLSSNPGKETVSDENVVSRRRSSLRQSVTQDDSQKYGNDVVSNPMRTTRTSVTNEAFNKEGQSVTHDDSQKHENAVLHNPRRTTRTSGSNEAFNKEGQSVTQDDSQKHEKDVVHNPKRTTRTSGTNEAFNREGQSVTQDDSKKHENDVVHNPWRTTRTSGTNAAFIKEGQSVTQDDSQKHEKDVVHKPKRTTRTSGTNETFNKEGQSVTQDDSQKHENDVVHNPWRTTRTSGTNEAFNKEGQSVTQDDSKKHENDVVHNPRRTTRTSGTNEAFNKEGQSVTQDDSKKHENDVVHNPRRATRTSGTNEAFNKEGQSVTQDDSQKHENDVVHNPWRTTRTSGTNAAFIKEGQLVTQDDSQKHEKDVVHNPKRTTRTSGTNEAFNREGQSVTQDDSKKHEKDVHNPKRTTRTSGTNEAFNREGQSVTQDDSQKQENDVAHNPWRTTHTSGTNEAFNREGQSVTQDDSKKHEKDVHNPKRTTRTSGTNEAFNREGQSVTQDDSQKQENDVAHNPWRTTHTSGTNEAFNKVGQSVTQDDSKKHEKDVVQNPRRTTRTSGIRETFNKEEEADQEKPRKKAPKRSYGQIEETTSDLISKKSVSRSAIETSKVKRPFTDSISSRDSTTSKSKKNRWWVKHPILVEWKEPRYNGVQQPIRGVLFEEEPQVGQIFEVSWPKPTSKKYPALVLEIRPPK